MPNFTGKSINLSIQEAFEDAVTQALVSKAQETDTILARVELVKVYAQRHGEGAFRNLFVEIRAE